MLRIVSQNNIDTGNGSNLPGIILGKATYHRNCSRRVLRQSLTNGIPALFFGNRRDRTCVYNIQIRTFLIRHYVKSRLYKSAL